MLARLLVALASSALHFRSTFWPSNTAHDQLSYFEALHTAAGVFGSASDIVLLARGAVYGQMLGTEHEN